MALRAMLLSSKSVRLSRESIINSMNFEWDPAEAAANLTRHGVSFEEASEVFGDGLSSTARDPDHSEGEDRYLIFGRTQSGKYLAVAFTERGDTMRLISARAMSPQERRAYET